MARARNIKPGFFKNADLLELPFEARLLFIGLWTIADRDGRLEDRPKQIKVEIFPGDNVDCDAALTQLASIHMIARYQVNGSRFIEICNFKKHQNPHRDERASLIPAYATNSVASMQAPEQHGASIVQKSDLHCADTVQQPCKDAAASEVVGLNPDSLLLIPDSLNLNPDSTTNTRSATLPREDETGFSGATRPGAVCVVLKSEGIAQVNPGHPDLLELLDAGAQLTDFVAACEIAHGANKGHFGYVLGIVRRRMEDAKKPAKKRKKISSNAEREIETFKERDERHMRKKWEEMTGREHPDNIAEREAAESQKTVTSKTVWQPLSAPSGVPA